MNQDEIYRAWSAERRRIDVREHFSPKVMAAIENHERRRAGSLFNSKRVFDWLAAHPVAQAGLVAAGAFVGFLRLVFVLFLVLEI